MGNEGKVYYQGPGISYELLARAADCASSMFALGKRESAFSHGEVSILISTTFTRVTIGDEEYVAFYVKIKRPHRKQTCSALSIRTVDLHTEKNLPSPATAELDN